MIHLFFIFLSLLTYLVFLSFVVCSCAEPPLFLKFFTLLIQFQPLHSSTLTYLLCLFGVGVIKQTFVVYGQEKSVIFGRQLIFKDFESAFPGFNQILIFREQELENKI